MKKFKFKSKKHISLSLVALILIMLMTVSVTYSWIDDIKQIQITTSDDAEGTPLKTGVDINAKINITKGNNTINLGDMIDEDNDIKRTENATTGLKYDNDGTPSKNYDTDTINSNKGYFYESGDLHLSGCYSDGEHFYFQKGTGNAYREGNKDDENVNYISFTTQISSPDASVDFWFKSVPTICKHGSSTPMTNARFAINVDGNNHVYSHSGNALTCNSGLTGGTTLSGVRKTSKYTYNHDDNTTTDYGQNSNVLFSIKEGATATVTFKIWLENGFSDTTAVDIDMSLVSSWAYTRTIRIDDRTTTNSKKSWLNDDSATMFLTCPKVLQSLSKKIYNSTAASYWDDVPGNSGYDYAPFKTLTKNTTLSTQAGYDVYTVEIPMVYNNERMIIYRCSNSGWNTGTKSNQDGDYGVTYWNWWTTLIPNRYTTGTYTLYGGSHDVYSGYVVTDDSKKNTNLGYGTWGGVDEIRVNPNYHGVNWASYDSSTQNTNVYIRDYSDDATSGETYVHSMYWDSDASRWTATIPKSSTLIQFLYTVNSVIKGCYGYHSYNNTNPQMRPLLSNGTDRDCDYLFAFKNDRNSNINGIGYWQSNDYVYIIKNGSFSSTTNFKSYFFYKYMWGYGYDNNVEKTYENAAWSGTSMSKISAQYTDANGTYDVYKSQALDSTNSKNMYPDTRRETSNDSIGRSNYANPNSDGAFTVDTSVIFSNNGSGQTGDLIVFPGCYWDPAGNCWRGSLTDTGRSAADTGVVEGSGETSSGTISGYTVDSGFTVQLNGVTHTVYTDSSGQTFKVRLPLANGDNWCTFQKNYLNYGSSNSGQHFDVPVSGLNINLNKGTSNNISLRVTSSSNAGNYIVTFTYDNGNTNTIKVVSALKES